MNWNRTLRRGGGRKTAGNDNSTSYKKALAAALLLMGWGASCNFIYADVTVANPGEYGHTVTTGNIAGGGTKYDITNQMQSGKNALNRFETFGIGQKDIANLHMGTADRQINIVNQKIDIQGVVNALKDNKIGGDVYLLSSKGIAVGATGVINVGRLTLGTNTFAGEQLFLGNPTFDNLSAANRAGAFGAANGSIDIQGKIHTADGAAIGAGDNITVGSGAAISDRVSFAVPQDTWTADDYRSRIVNLSGVTQAAQAVDTGSGVVLLTGGALSMEGTIASGGSDITLEADKNLTMKGSVSSSGGRIELRTEDNLYVEGTAAREARITSSGGKILLTASSSDADLQAEPDKVPSDGMISIKDAYIDSGSTTKDSGDIEITAVRDVMGVSRVDIRGATIDAGGDKGHNAGNVTIHSTAQTQLYAWDIGDGAYAQIYMGKSGNKDNTITGDNIDIKADASTTGDIGKDNTKTEAETKADIQNTADENAVLGLLKDVAGNLRGVISATKIRADAVVDIDDTSLNAVGGAKGGTGTESNPVPHGNLSINSEARSIIQPITGGVVGFGVNVGISDITSKVTVDNSSLYADGNTEITAVGDNRVKMSFIELGLLDSFVRSTANMSWAQLSSDVSAQVGEGTRVTSGGNVNLSARSVRSLQSSVSNGSDANVIGLAGAVAIADTNASAEMAGNVYAGGDVSVSAENTLAKTDSGIYEADTSKASSMSGDSALKPTVDKAKDIGGTIFGKIKEAAAKAFKTEGDGEVSEETPDADRVNDTSKPWNKLGVNAATALLFSENNSKASVTGKVRGIFAEKTNGKWMGNETAGAKSLDVSANTLSRTLARVGTYQQELTNKGSPEQQIERKKTGIAASVAYMSQDNTSEAFVSGDVKTKGDVTVKAETKIPWQTKLAGTSPSEILMNAVFNGIDNMPIAPDLVDSWTQSAGEGQDISGSASISIIDYRNDAKAYIGKKDDKQTTKPVVDAGGKVTVDALTDITTVNFSGNIKNPLKEAPINFWQGMAPNKEWIGGDKPANAIGGVALSVYQKNDTNAYIDGGAVVTAGSVDVNAKTEAWNLAMTASGGMAESLAIDATIGVNRFDNATNAYIGEANVTAEKGDVTITAEDMSVDLNLAGAMGIAESTGVGASVAYNAIERITNAYINGTVTANSGNVKAEAKNTGEIIAASVAGAVTYDSKQPDVDNMAGSTGFHAPDDDDDDSEGTVEEGFGLGDLANEITYDPDGDWLLDKDDVDKTISKVADQDASMADNAKEAQNGFSAAANVSVNRIVDSAKAYAAKKEGAAAAPVITAGALGIHSLNDSKIYAVSGTVSASANTKKSNAIAGSFMYNAITADNEAYVDGATLHLSGNQEKDDKKEEIDESLTVEAENQGRILNIAASGAGVGKGNAVAGQISLNWIDNTNAAYVKDSAVYADEAVKVRAENGADIDSYTGAVAFSGGGKGTAVGASIAVNLIDGESDAHMENTSIAGEKKDRAGKIAAEAADTSLITSIVASGGAADGFAGAFSSSGNAVTTKTKAYVDSSKAVKAGHLSVSAKNLSNATIGVGTAAVGNNAAGASVAVMVNKSDVDAYVKGDASKANTMDTTGLSITAENLYNGSASEDDKDSTAKTVAIGAAGGASKFAGSGSVTVNVIDQKTDALLGAGKYAAGKGDVTITADTQAHLFGMAGGLAVSGGTGIGAAVDTQVYDGHTYAGIGSGASLSGAKSVTVKADSMENLTSVAATIAGGGKFAGAGAAGAHDIDTDTKAYIGSENEEDNTGKAELTEAGAVTVAAKDTTKLGTGAGSGAVGGSAGVGLSAAVEVVNKKVDAHIGADSVVTGTGLSVTAENTSSSTTASAGLGAGGSAGVAGSASETFVTHDTKAYIGKNAQMTTPDAGTTVKALSSFKQGSGAGSAAVGGTASVGIANATVSLTADTKAYVGEGASITGKKAVIDASHTTDITYATIAGAVSTGQFAANGAVGVNVLRTSTHAYAGDNAELTAEGTGEEEGISITASDVTKLHGGNGGLAVGATGGGAGAAIAVNQIRKDTQAYVGKGTKLASRGRVAIGAAAEEDIFNLSLQGSGGMWAGLAGAVNVLNLDAVTKAYTNTGAEINQKEGYTNGGGDISLTASHEVTQLMSTAVGAAGAAVSIGAAVDVANIKTQTNAYIGDGSHVNTKGALAVDADDNMHDISSNPYAAAVGGFGLSGSITVYNFGSKMSDEDAKTLSGKTSEDGSEVSFDDWVGSQLNTSGTGTAMAAYDSGALAGIKEKLGENFAVEAPDTAGEKGTAAKIGNGAVISAGSVSVTADDKISMLNTMGNVSYGGTAAAGMSVGVVRTDTETKALIDDAASVTTAGALKVAAASDHAAKSVITGASVSGQVAGQGTVYTWKDISNVSALIGDTTGITAGSISVSADNDRTLDSVLTGAAVALYGALNGAVVTADAEGTAKAGIGSEEGEGKYAGEVKADGDISITSAADTKLSATVTGAAAGLFSGTGTGVDLSSAVDTKSFVGKGETLMAGKLQAGKLTGGNISVTSRNTPVIEGLATAAGAGLAGIGVTVAKASSNDSSSVAIGDGASLAAGDLVKVRAEMTRPEDTSAYTAYMHAIAGAGGVIAGAVSASDVRLDHDVTAGLGKNVQVSAGSFSLEASHDDIVNARNESVGAGKYSGTGADLSVTVDSAVKSSIGDGTVINTAGTTSVLAENKSEKNWAGGGTTLNAFSGGAALATGSGIVNTTSITHTTSADIGKVTISAFAPALTDEEKKDGKTIHDKNAISIDARSDITAKDYLTITTGSAVGAAHIKNTNTAKADTTVAVASGADFKAGDTEEANTFYDKEEYAAGASHTGKTASYSGGSIGIGTRNDADLLSETVVDVFGAAGYAGSENNVTYNGMAKTTFDGKAETALGDIRTAAGRDSSGAAGSITARANGDILNATAIPISVNKDPTAKITSDADLLIGKDASIRSDRDIYFQSTGGNTYASGYGEVKDWVNAVGEAFGAEGSKVGKSQVLGDANAKIEGKAETGIHRNLSITIWGVPEKDSDGYLTGKWITYVKRNGQISYTIGETVPVGADLFQRLDELQNLKGDPAAMASYESERNFIEAKLVEQGLGYYTKGGQFVRMPSDDTSELESVKGSLSQYDQDLTKYENAQKEAAAQQGALETLGNAYKDWKDASNALAGAETSYNEALSAKNTAQSTLDSAKGAMDTAYGKVEAKAEAAGYTNVDAYMEANASEQVVLDYNAAVTAYNAAGSALSAASTAWETARSNYEAAESAAGTAQTSYQTAAKSYNTSYNTGYAEDPSSFDTTGIKTEWDALVSEQSIYGSAIEGITYQKNQVAATEDFQKKAGFVEENGHFYVTIDGKKTEWTETQKNDKGEDVTVTGYYTYNGVQYSLLHTKAYQRLTHNFTIGDITAQLGDIHLEADTVSGAGSLAAGGDAKVTISNNSPHNLIVGNVTVSGKGGTTAAGQGGMIFYNGSALQGSAADVKAGILAANKDKTASFTGSVETRNTTDKPQVTIESNFRPTAEAEYMVGGEPVFAAPSLTIGGYVYNPRGGVTVKSASGDVYNKGRIEGGIVDVAVASGDYIQSYSPDADKGMTNIGGTPIDDSGNVQTEVGSGILANGNVFISARYVNINSKIQSGLADWKVNIPENYVLYYKDGSGQVVEVTEDAAKKMTGTTIYVGVKKGNAIVSAVSNESGNDAKDNYLTYDAANDRFALSGIEVHGGQVSITGTILNTSKDGKGQIQALDGYGSIAVKNLSGKDLELVNLSTGSGVEGKIQITDLDWKNGGRKARTTTYTRKDGTVTAEVETFSYDKSGKLTGSAKSTAAADKYDTNANQWYSYQTGTDSSVTKTYEYHGTRADWWGIENEQPTLEELLDIGGKQTGYEPGTPTVLNGGAYVSGSSVVDNAETGKTTSGDGGYWTKSEVTFDKAGSEPSEIWDIRSKRLWYTLGFAKKWDVKLDQTTEHTTIQQTSVKADYDIGIGFIGTEAGGKLSIAGGSQNVYVSGSISNAGGTTTISGNNIVSGGGLITTGSLVMNASGNAGTAGSAIETNASHVSGKAGGDFAVSIADHGVTTGTINAGGTAAITAAGDITQDAGALLTGKRIELTAENGAITGAEGAALQISATGQEYAKDTGLKASAYGNISIENTSGDLYLDSVTSEAGDVTLTTSGSFVDNNFTDTEDEDAKAKLLGWANKAVLENSEQTITKQKDMLVYKVEEKYSRYQALAANVKDGKYTLSDAEKDILSKNGVDADTYIAERQAEYDSLVDAGVGTWTAETVKAYTDGIRASKDTIYGNASLTKDALAGDTFLTQDEKASILVGSAKSAKDLLITFSPGGIKEGITDTNTTIKQVPHVSGVNVSLIANGNGDKGSGSIGKKTEGMKIDLSAGNLEHLTSAELLALASAERGDFKVDGDKVTVSSVSSIAADAAGTITAKALKGGLYLVTENGYNEGSKLFADDELRLKASGDITGITVGSNDQIVLESGEGKISNVTISEGNGVLTARAKDGVSLTKDSGDLVIHTVYASEGDVELTVADGASIYGEGGNDADDEAADKVQGTTFVNIQGENVKISAKDGGQVKHLGTNGTEDGEGKYNSLGIKVTGTPASEAREAAQPGTFTAHISGHGDVTFFGDITDGTQVKTGTSLHVTSRGTIAGGTFETAGALSVHNAAEHAASQAPKGTITGGTFIGQSASITNESEMTTNEAGQTTGGITGGTFTANGTGTEDKLTIHNAGTLAGGNFTGQSLADLSNTGTIAGGTYTGASVNAANAGTLSEAVITAKSGTLTFTDTAEAVTGGEEGKEVHLKADGDVTITAKGAFDVTGMTSGGKTTLTSAQSASIGTLEAGSASLETTVAGSSLTVNTSNVTNGYTVDVKGDAKLDEVTSGETSITAGGNVTNNSLTAGGDVTINAGGTLESTTVTAENSHVSTESAGGTTIGSLTADSASLTTTGEGGDLKVNLSEVAGELVANAAGAADLHTVNAGKTTIEAGGNVTNGSLNASGDTSIKAVGTIESGTLTAEGRHVQTESIGETTIGSLTAGSASLVTTGAGSGLHVTTSKIAGDLTAKAAGNAVLTNVEAGKTTIEAGGNVTNGSLNATGDVTITAETGSITFGTLAAENNSVTLKSGTTTNVTTLTGGTTSITAGGSVESGTLTTTGDLTVKADEAIKANTIKSEDQKVILGAGTNVTVDTLTGGSAEITAEKGDISLIHSTVKDLLNLDAGANVTLTESVSKTLGINAGKNITGVTITSGDIEMNADGHIHLTTEDHVNKLDGVDLTGKPLPVTGSGSAGSLLTGSAEGHTFGGASGSASLTSNTGKVTLTAGDTVEADNIHLDTAGGTGEPQTGGTAQLHLNGNVIGVDNVSGTGETEKVHITINGGADQDPAYHAGIHSGNPDVETIVTGSHIQHLDLTGKDKVGVTNTHLSGNSVIATDTVRTEIGKNGNTGNAEHIGSLFLSGTNIETGELFTDIKNGITINGVRFPYTASGVMARALYGDQYLGRDGREKEEKELAAKDGEILFAEVSHDEQYHAVTM